MWGARRDCDVSPPMRSSAASLLLTALCATAATLIGVVTATPLAYLLARRTFPGRALLSAILDLPLLIPHPVAGIALLLLLGRESAVGGAALEVGLRIVGRLSGFIAAMLFVSAPLFVSGAREAFAKVDPRYEGVARTLGDNTVALLSSGDAPTRGAWSPRVPPW